MTKLVGWTSIVASVVILIWPTTIARVYRAKHSPLLNVTKLRAVAKFSKFRVRGKVPEGSNLIFGGYRVTTMQVSWVEFCLQFVRCERGLILFVQLLSSGIIVHQKANKSIWYWFGLFIAFALTTIFNKWHVNLLQESKSDSLTISSWFTGNQSRSSESKQKFMFTPNKQAYFTQQIVSGFEKNDYWRKV